MKKIISLILAFVFTMCCFTVNVSAQSVNVDDTDITIEVDSKEWSVFTRKNVSGNSELKSMGISTQYFYDAMINTNVYLDMFCIKDNSRETIEFKIYKENGADVNNYTNLSDRKLRKKGEAISDKRDANKWQVYSNENDYIYMEYNDIEYNYVEYYTVVNQETYRLVATKSNKFSELEKEIIKKIVDSAEYKINPIYANEKVGIQKYWEKYGIQTVVVIILACIAVGAVILYKKRDYIKNIIKGNKAPKEEPAPKPASMSKTKSAPKVKSTSKPASAPKPKKPADASMVTIDRSKRKPRKK